MSEPSSLPEEDVFAAQTSTVHPDDWPEYELHNARVFRPSDGEPVSLHQANEHHPLNVVGVLQPESDENAHLFGGERKTQTVRVADVKLFAYGTYHDGSVAIWAAGNAVWYNIKPDSSYKQIYDNMIEAVKVFYFIVDAYNEKRKTVMYKNKKTSPEYTVEELFQKYATEVLGNSQHTNEAARRIHKHRDFLFTAMMTGKEQLSWSRNPMYVHLCREFPQHKAQVKMRMTDARAMSGSATRQASTDSIPKILSQRRTWSDSSTIKAASSTGSSEMERQTTPVFDGLDEMDDETSHRSKSLLRLRSSFAAKGFAKGGKTPASKIGTGGIVNTPTQSSAASKRKAEADLHKQQIKRRVREESDEGLVFYDCPSGTEDDGAVQTLADLATRMRHTPDPVQEDTWVCALDGCSHKVYAASDHDGQRLIQQHYALHAYDDDERVQLVKTFKAPSLPVGHLVERVRMAAKDEGFSGSKNAGKRFPAPVVRRY